MAAFGQPALQLEWRTRYEFLGGCGLLSGEATESFVIDFSEKHGDGMLFFYLFHKNRSHRSEFCLFSSETVPSLWFCDYRIWMRLRTEQLCDRICLEYYVAGLYCFVSDGDAWNSSFDS